MSYNEHENMHSSINTSMLSGIVDSLPKINTSSSNSQYAVWSISVVKLIKSRDSQETKRITSWFSLISYNQTVVDMCAKLNKGDKILVQGSLNVRTWQDQETEKKKTKYEINVETMTLLSGGSLDSSSHSSDADEGSHGYSDNSAIPF